MKLFRKRKQKGNEPAAWLWKGRLIVEQGQRKFADYLARRTQYWSRLSWVIALGLFILLFGGSCLFLCIKAFIHFKK